MPFCVVNFRNLDQLTVAASHDQPWWPPLTINEVGKNGGRLSRSTTVAASHDQPRWPPLTINQVSKMVAASHDQLRVAASHDQPQWPPLTIKLELICYYTFCPKKRPLTDINDYKLILNVLK